MTLPPEILAWSAAGVAASGLTVGGLAWQFARKRNMQYWLPEYLFPSERKPRLPLEQLDVFISVCDHFEPQWGRPSRQTAIARVDRWCRDYPKLFAQFRDSRDRPPQHTFFFPQDEYQPEYLDRLTLLVEDGFGDVDIHLHHDQDTPDGLREKLETFRDDLHNRHGLLRRDPVNGQLCYGFIHGNWALCNSRPDGRWCGVDQELTILKETGCYADFTMPSAPSDTQTSTINSIYYAFDRPGQCKSHNFGVRARVGQAAPEDGLLMIQGPLCLDWQNRRAGIFPRIENSDLHVGRPGNMTRLQHWIRSGVHVAGRPNWIFIKLHTHGAKDGNIDTLLGPETQQFHRELAWFADQHPGFRYHYVTAWEMAQLVHRAERNESVPIFGVTSDPDRLASVAGG